MSDSESLGPMIFSPQGFQGLVVAPHHLAARAGLRVLDEGGDAVEAMKDYLDRKAKMLKKKRTPKPKEKTTRVRKI